MKIQTAKLLFGIAFGLMTAPFCQADYETKFNEPPYELGKTIVDVDGWVPTKSSNNGSKAYGIMVVAPWDSTSTVLRLQGGDNTQKVRVKNSSFAPFSGEVKVVVGMAFNFDPLETAVKGARSSFAFFDLASGRSPISFGLDYDANGGLFYDASTATTPNYVKILDANEIKMNSLYEFTLLIHLEQETFDIFVTGLKADGDPFSASALSIPTGTFKDGIPVIDTLYVENMGSINSTAYLDHVGIYAIPEPGSTALILGGGIVALLGAYMKKRRTGN